MTTHYVNIIFNYFNITLSSIFITRILNTINALTFYDIVNSVFLCIVLNI